MRQGVALAARVVRVQVGSGLLLAGVVLTRAEGGRKAGGDRGEGWPAGGAARSARSSKPLLLSPPLRQRLLRPTECRGL